MRYESIESLLELSGKEIAEKIERNDVSDEVIEKIVTLKKLPNRKLHNPLIYKAILKKQPEESIAIMTIEKLINKNKEDFMDFIKIEYATHTVYNAWGEILNQKNCPYEILEKEVKSWNGIDRLLSYRKSPLPNELAIEFIKNADKNQLRRLVYGSGLLSKDYPKEFFYLLFIKADFLDYEDLARFHNNIIPLA